MREAAARAHVVAQLLQFDTACNDNERRVRESKAAAAERDVRPSAAPDLQKGEQGSAP